MVVQLLPFPPLRKWPIFQTAAAIASESIAVNSAPSCSPALTNASRLRIWVTTWVLVNLPIACASYQPTSGTLTHSGFAASETSRIRNLVALLKRV